MPQDELTYSPLTNEYKFGFNGAEKENEIYGEGNAYDLGLRMYDSRIARMFKIDPRTFEYPWQSPYVYHRNSPISIIDILGGGGDDPLNKIGEVTNTTTTENTTDKGVRVEEITKTQTNLYENTETGDYMMEQIVTKTFNSYNKSGDLITSSETTNTSMTNMNSDEESGYELVGMGVYGNANASFVGAVADASGISYTFFSEPHNEYIMTSTTVYGVGIDFGVSGGLVFIYGPKELKPSSPLVQIRQKCSDIGTSIGNQRFIIIGYFLNIIYSYSTYEKNDRRSSYILLEILFLIILG